MLAVPIVTRDLSSEQCVADVAHALDRLDSTLDAVLDRISQRAEVERSRLASISTRIGRCEAKVSAMRQMKNRATTVMSKNRFPVRKQSRCEEDLVDFETPADREACSLGSSLLGSSLDESCAANAQLEAECVELWARLNARQRVTPSDDDVRKQPCVESVTSLLLFNSEASAYGPPAAPTPTRRRPPPPPPIEADLLHDAPESILRGTRLPDVAQLDYQFKPNVAQMARLELPLNLPLPNLADLQFNVTQRPPPPPPRPRPPPPPPPRPLAILPAPKKKPPPPPAPREEPDLMSAIRRFSAADLQKEEEKPERRKITDEPKKAEPISMMEEMRARLNRRHLSITGQSDTLRPPQDDQRPPPPQLPRGDSIFSTHNPVLNKMLAPNTSWDSKHEEAGQEDAADDDDDDNDWHEDDYGK